MNIKRFSQISENFEPIYDFITEVEADLYGLPKDVDSHSSKAKVHWKLRPIIKKDSFSFQVWMQSVKVESFFTYDDEREEEKTFEYDAEQIKYGSEPDKEDMGYTIRPESVEIYFKDGKEEVTINWG